MMRRRKVVQVRIERPGGLQMPALLPLQLAATLAEIQGAGAIGLSVPSFAIEAYRKRVRKLRKSGVSIKESRGRLVLCTPIVFVEALGA